MLPADFVGGFHDLVGVVDHTRRQEDHQFGARLGDALRAEQGADSGQPVQKGHARGTLQVSSPG